MFMDWLRARTIGSAVGAAKSQGGGTRRYGGRRMRKVANHVACRSVSVYDHATRSSLPCAVAPRAADLMVEFKPRRSQRLLSWPVLVLAVQTGVLCAWTLLGGGGGCSWTQQQPRLGVAGLTGGSSVGGSLPPPTPPAPPVQAARPVVEPGWTFQAPQSLCQVLPDGSVHVPQPGQSPNSSGIPFLFNTSAMPTRKQSCAHCPPDEDRQYPPCCGVCIFTTRRCDDFYPGQRRAEAAAKLLLESDPLLRGFSPCELFARIRGRTLWIMGDSQAWNYYLAAECFLREFSLTLRRSFALMPEEENNKLMTREAPELPPLCLDLAFGTRVCGIRVYSPGRLTDTVLPLLMARALNFKNDLVVYNFGLHFPKPGLNGKEAGSNALVQALAGLADWREQHAADLPSFIWMDTPPQHFDTPDGTWPGGPMPFTCRPLAAWSRGDPAVLAGGPFNTAVAHLVPRLSDAHLRVYNASVPVWNAHWAGECTHWCHPTVYQHWLHLLNNLLRDSRLGNTVQVYGREAVLGPAAQPGVPAAASPAAAAAAAVAEMQQAGSLKAAAAAAAAGGAPGGAEVAAGALLANAGGDGGGGAAVTETNTSNTAAAEEPAEALPKVPVTANASAWDSGAAEMLTTLHSLCSVHRNGSVLLPPAAAFAGRTPFLLDPASMPARAQACAHCPANEPPAMPPCCGVCQFAKRKCDDFYPGQQRSQAVAHHLMTNLKFPLQEFTPCELFARIRGRTLWLMGDSQMWNVYYATECFMRELSTTLQRRPVLTPKKDNDALITVRAPVPYPPICLELALKTRVCIVRVDGIKDMMELVLPTLIARIPTFTNDILVFNFGLHYVPPGAEIGPNRPANQTGLYVALAELADWRREHLTQLPRFIWMDTPVQHFSTRTGAWPGGPKPFKCSPLHAWFRSEPDVVAGGPYNAPLESLVPRLADAHLRTWNASVTLWRTHWPEECSHWCHPSAYQLWLFLLNKLLHDEGIGNHVDLPGTAEPRAGGGSGSRSGGDSPV